MTNRKLKEYTPREKDKKSILDLRGDLPLMFIGGQRDPKIRPCNKCDKEFLSEGFHNRLCEKCSRQNGYIVERVAVLYGEPNNLRGRQHFAKKILDGY